MRNVLTLQLLSQYREKEDITKYATDGLEVGIEDYAMIVQDGDIQVAGITIVHDEL